MLKIELCDGVMPPHRGVLKAAEFQENLRVVGIAECARRMMRRQLIAHKAELRQEREKAFQKAYDEGLKQFLDAARALHESREKQSKELETLLKECLDTVFDSCSAQDFTNQVIGPVIEKLKDQSKVSIIVDPSSVSEFEKAVDQLPLDSTSGLNITVEASERSQNGECTIYTGDDVLDLSLSVVTDRLIRSVAHSFSSDGGSGAENDQS